MRRSLPAILAAALATSLGLNLLLLLRPDPAPASAIPPERASGRAPYAATPRPAPGTTPAARAVSLSDLPDLLLEDRPRLRVETEVTPALQQDVLSQIAREHLGRHWDGSRESILGVLRAWLADPERQRLDHEKDLAAFASATGAPPAAMARFASELQQARARRIAALSRAMDRQPPDLPAVHAELRGLFADEDALAARHLGPEARERLRLSRLEHRTALLAISARYAGAAWEDGITW